jgi:hypothetical protein
LNSGKIITQNVFLNVREQAMKSARKHLKQARQAAATLGLAMLFLVFSLPSAFADRTRAGGGKAAEADIGGVFIDFAGSAASSVVGSAVSSATSSLLGTASQNAFTAGNILSNATGSFSNSVATNQIGRAASAMGNYYGWGKDTTFFVSTVARGAASGALNPGIAGRQYAGSVETMDALRGAGMGILSEGVNAGIMLGIDGDKIRQGKAPGAGAQLAGLWGSAAFSSTLIGGPHYKGAVDSFMGGSPADIFTHQSKWTSLVGQSVNVLVSSSGAENSQGKDHWQQFWGKVAGSATAGVLGPVAQKYNLGVNDWGSGPASLQTIDYNPISADNGPANPNIVNSNRPTLNNPWPGGLSMEMNIIDSSFAHYDD